MKPAPFDIRFPSTVDEALAFLDDLGDDARPLAGGQSLIPLLNFRLAQPEVLVDLGDLHELRYVRRAADGGLHIGAMTTLSVLLGHPKVLASHPVLAQAIRHVAHEPIRNRGTLGGSLAHMDPAAEMPALMLLLDAEVVVRSRSATRVVPVRDFVRGAYVTAIADGELLTEIRIPALPPGARTAMKEVANRAGDFGLAGAACSAALTSTGVVEELRLVVFASSAMPTRLPEVEARSVGGAMSAEMALEVAGTYAGSITPLDDRHGSADFRRHLTRVMATRVIREATGLRLP